MKNLIVIIALIIFFQIASAQEKIPGFNIKSTLKEKELESKFEKQINSANLDQWMKKMTAHPHHVGSPYNSELCRFIAGQFNSWGFEVKVDTYYVLFPTPKIREVEMTAPVKYKALLAEPRLSADATSGQILEQLPTYNAYSADGNVEGELVYVNFGVKQDYELLDRMGVSVKGKIVIARYMGSWRGIKPKLAAEHGAIGCIIYSDPKDDGYFQGDVYPEGAFRNETGVQRGSVKDMPVYPGDPLTPETASTKSAKRLELSEAFTLTKIPVLPLSYHDAKPLLAALKGQVCPEAWRGALPITYHVGPGPARVKINLKFNWDIKPIYDVIATLKDSKYPDQWIIRGNHYDAWVNGAADPVSGIVSLMEEARITGMLARDGNHPDRTIVFCAWDAEEPGLNGSTEWVEDHEDVLINKAVIYINTDGIERGFLYSEGSHSLNSWMESIYKSVKDPETGVSVFERLKAFQMVKNGKDKYKGFQMEALGSGSDYTPFIQHLGISSVNLAYGGEGNGGEYHSIYDSYDDYTRFKDPGFRYCATMVATTGFMTLRLANAEILPFNFGDMDSTVSSYIKELTELSNKKRKENSETNFFLQNNMFMLAADPQKEYHSPEIKKEVPFLNFAPLQNALMNLDEMVRSWEKINFDSLTERQKADYNQLAFLAERSLLIKEGLPGRPWYKHALYAPGLYTGYDVKTMPGIREAIEDENWERAQQQIDIMARVIMEYNEHLNKIVQLNEK